ncbi:MAG: hypothetical protein M3O46_05550, partial [Myxococcota bacterium]|nr:hypothetical protein [Myxococcota bacterium]
VGVSAALLAPACSLGQGSGSMDGWLDATDCWSGCFDLHPDFFAAIPTNSSALQIRVQNGIDYETFSDGLFILVDDSQAVRSTMIDKPLAVSLPAAVTPPGVPVKPIANPALVHATLYLNRSCRTQNVGLYAMDCSLAGGVDPPLCGDAGLDAALDASTIADDAGAPASTALSTMTFHSLFDGDVNESNAQQRLTDADFDIYLANPREISAGGLGPPPPCRGHIKGRFRFYFQRGRPAQPFP